MESTLVPQQQTGSEMDARSETILTDLSQALLFYQAVKGRLVDVNNWDNVCGTSATTFQLTLPDGTETDELKVGNLIKIDIPGPGTSAGDGYDWVQIERIDASEPNDLEEWTGFTVRPCPSPLYPKMGVAHFFSDLATSTFIVGRNEKTVWAEMHGRNEVSNANTDKLFDGLRNAMVGWTAKIGLSYPQWKLLVDGLVQKDN
jgi:hypothetical protein